MTRLEKFEALADHPWYGRMWKKLSSSERTCAVHFLVENENASKDEFEIRINRLFLDREKSKNADLIVELLSVSNSA